MIPVFVEKCFNNPDHLKLGFWFKMQNHFCFPLHNYARKGYKMAHNYLQRIYTTCSGIPRRKFMAIVSNRGYNPFREDAYWNKGEYHHLPLQGKGLRLERRNHQGPKRLDQAMGVVKRVAKNFLRQQVRIDDMQFGLMPGRITIDVIFIVRQLKEKFHATNKTMYIAFVDLEKAFYRVPRSVIWLALRKIWRSGKAGVAHTEDVWHYQQQSACWLQSEWRDPCEVDVHEGFCLSPLLFTTVLEALSQEFHTGYPWENLNQTTWSSSLNHWRNCKETDPLED